MQAFGIGLLDFTENYPALSQFALLSWILGYVGFSLLGRNLRMWKKAATTDRFLLAFGFGIALNFLVIFPAYIMVKTWFGEAVNIDLFMSANFQPFIVAMLVMLIARRALQHEYSFRLIFKSSLIGIFLTTWFVFASITAMAATTLTNPYQHLVQPLVQLGLLQAFSNMILAGTLALIGFFVFDYFFFSPIQRNEFVPLGKQKSLKYIRIPVRELIGGLIFAAIIGVVIIVADANMHGFTPYVDEGEELFYRDYSELLNPIYIDIDHTDIDNYITVRYYQDAIKQYTIYPPSLGTPISINSISIPNPSNSSHTYSKNFARLCNCIYVQLPNKVTAKTNNDSNVTDITIDFSSYQKGEPVKANFSYGQVFAQRAVNISLNRTTEEMDELTKEIYSFTIINNEDAPAVVREILIQRFLREDVDKESLGMILDSLSKEPSFAQKIYAWAEVSPHKKSVLTITFTHKNNQ